MFIRGYLGASTDEQDTHLAKIGSYPVCKAKRYAYSEFLYREPIWFELERAELSRLIDDSHQNDILLIEKVDRPSRLPYEQWRLLKHQLVDAGIHIVEIDQPMALAIYNGMAENSMILKVLAEFMIDLARQWPER